MPDPITSSDLIPFSSKIFLAAGEGEPEANVMSFSILTTVSFFESLTISIFVFSSLVFLDVFFPDVSIKQTILPTSTVSPSSALRVIVPLSWAGKSNVALSESTSAIV